MVQDNTQAKNSKPETTAAIADNDDHMSVDGAQVGPVTPAYTANNASGTMHSGTPTVGPAQVYQGFCTRFRMPYKRLKRRCERVGMDIDDDRDTQEVLTWCDDTQFSFFHEDIRLPEFHTRSMVHRLQAVIDHE